MGAPFGQGFGNRYSYGQLLRDHWGNRGNVDAVMLDLTFKKREELMFSSAGPSKLYALIPLHGTDSTGILVPRRDQFLLKRQKVTLKLPPLLVRHSCAKVGVTHVNRLLIINPK